MELLPVTFRKPWLVEITSIDVSISSHDGDKRVSLSSRTLKVTNDPLAAMSGPK